MAAHATAGPGPASGPGGRGGPRSSPEIVTWLWPFAREGSCPFGTRAFAAVTLRNVHPSCTLVEDHFAVRVLPSLRVPSPSLFLSPVAACLATPLPHPCALILAGGRFSFRRALSGRPAGPATLRVGPRAAPGSAGRTRLRGPGPLYTVRRDLDGHVGLDVMGGRSPQPPRPRGPRAVCAAGPGPGGTLLRGTCRPSLDPAAFVGTRGGHSLLGARPAEAVLVHPPSRVRTCGVEPPGPGPGGDVLGQPRPDGGEPITHGISQRPSGQTGEPWATGPGSDGVELGATCGTPPLCFAQGYCAAPA
jgi:hypothetical protein